MKDYTWSQRRANARRAKAQRAARRVTPAGLVKSQALDVATLTHSLPADARKVAKLQREFEEDAPAYLAVTITTPDEYTFADELLTAVVTRKDAAIAMRTSVTAPLYGVIRTVESWFRPLLEAIAPAEKHLRAIMGAYRVEQEAAEREARELAAQAAESGNAGALVTALEVATEAAAPVVARSSTTYKWIVDSVDANELPDEYWIPDRARLDKIARAAGSEGVPPVVPGVVFKRTATIGASRK